MDCDACGWSESETAGLTVGWLQTANSIHICRQKQQERERAYRKRNKDAAPGCGSQLPTSSAVTLLFRTTFIHTHTCMGIMWGLLAAAPMYAHIYLCISHTLYTRARSSMYVCMWIFNIHTCIFVHA